MNIYRELAENVWNPQISSGADIQRQLDLMDKLQGSSIKSSLDKNTGYDEEEFGSSQGLSQPAFTGMAMGNDPQASWGQVAYHSGLPFGNPYPGTPVASSKFSKGAMGIGSYLGQNALKSSLGPFASTPTNSFIRNYANPLAYAFGIPGFAPYGQQYGGMPNFAYNPTMNQFEVDRTITPLSQRGTLSGVDTSNIFGMFSPNVSTPTGQQAFIDAYSPGIQLGSIEAAMLGYTQPFVDIFGVFDTPGIGGLTGGTSIGGTTDGSSSVGEAGGIDGGPGDAY